MAKLRKILIMAGGTGGHVFPGLAVARLFREKNIEVHWLGTQAGLEARLVPEAQIPIHYISISGVRGKGWKNLLSTPWKLAKAIAQATKIIRAVKPDVIIGMGGFASGPGGIASWLLRYPLVIHEQNAKLGMTNKWLAYLANKTLEAFPNTFSHRKKVQTVGNPVRSEIIGLEAPENRFKNRTEPLRLLIVGGSLGAAAINQLVPETLSRLPLEDRPQVIHQTGEKHYETTVAIYKKFGVTAEIKPFIQEMDAVYSWADIVLCRAGALTVSELCAAGLGAILVPYPFAVDDHQTANADFMVKHNAAWIVQQQDLTAEKLLALLKELSQTREKCFFMAQSAYKSRKIHACEQVLKICEEICP